MTKRIIDIQNISRCFQVGKTEINAVKNISFNVNKNEYVALMGASGSGKSTLMNMLGCLDSPTSGKYFLNSKDVGALEDNKLAEIRNKEIGFIFQTFNLLPRSTALENVMLPLIYAGVARNEREAKSINMLKSVGLADRIHHKPNELSGGQRQRVAIARALINKPSIILADEPTGNLDSETSNDIMNLFSNIHQEGNTIIIVTHEAEIANRAKRIIRLKDGEIEPDKINK